VLEEQTPVYMPGFVELGKVVPVEVAHRKKVAVGSPVCETPAHPKEFGPAEVTWLRSQGSAN